MLKKKIGIDARLYSQTGIGTYLKNLLYYLEKENISNKVFYIYLLKDDFDKVKFKNKNFIKKLTFYRWHSFNEQVGFLKQLLDDHLNLMHFTYFSYPVFYPKKFLATIHDLTPILFKTGQASTKNFLVYFSKLLIFKEILKNQVNKSELIITPSKTVKDQLMKRYPLIKEKKIKVIYEGINYQLQQINLSSNLNNKFDKENFFIYVGNFYPHKNIERLIKAFTQVKEAVKLFLIGPDDFFYKRVKKLILQLKQEKRILHIKSPTLNDLVFFYKNCLALINPSISEGFGLPLVEAAYFNKPIIASNIDVFKELWGNQYLSFNPYSVEDIAFKIKFFLNKRPNFDYHNVLKKYSFKKMTKETLKIYQQLLE